MRGVLVTGIGIVSCIGNSRPEVLRSLQEGVSGLQFVPKMKELGFRIPVAGLVKGFDASRIPKGPRRTMSNPARYAAVAALEALEDSGLPLRTLKGTRVGVVVGTGAGGGNQASEAETLLLKHRRPSRLGALGPPQIMNATAALNLATWLGIKGRCYSVSSACCTGTDSIGHGFELIRNGILDICICGAAEDKGWSGWGFLAAGFMMPGPITTDLERHPSRVCRPYDRDRPGVMLMSEGAGVVILEAAEHAESRDASAYAEVAGYGSANDGDHMHLPNGRGMKRCIREALEVARSSDSSLRIDYANPHGAGTMAGDVIEVKVIRDVFGAESPLVSSTKPLNGHSQGAAGAHEAIFTLLMLHHGFIAPTANLENVDPECEGVRHVQSPMEVPLETAMSFNSGLGGSNACLIFRKA